MQYNLNNLQAHSINNHRFMSNMQPTIQDNLNKFMLSLYLFGVPISEEDKEKLVSNSYLTTDLFKKPDLVNFQNNYQSFSDVDLSTKIFGLDETGQSYMTEDDISRLEEQIRSTIDRQYQFSGKSGITKEMWTPDGLKVDYEKDFFKFINNINLGWQHYKPYHRFELYRKQCQDWLKERDVVWNSTSSYDTKLAYCTLERERMLENSLYALNKFGYIKSDDIDNEKGLKYQAWRAQELMLYLLDLKISYIMAKARQIGATTTIGGAVAIKTMLTKNFFAKMVAEKGDKSKELFRDKVKYVIDKFPMYLTPTINNDSEEAIRIVKKIAKGKTGGANSIFQVEAPTITCINGGSPSIVLLDEIGLYDIFGDIMSEGRPAMIGLNKDTGKQEFKRQVIAWGTGGNMEKGGAAMEQEYRVCKQAWLDRDFTSGMMPLFLNVFAREGLTKEVYESEKRFYYSREQKVGEKDHKIVFHQSYAVTEEDVFLLSSDTIIPTVTINKHLEKCRMASESKKKVYRRGYFAPLFDTSVPYDENQDVPFKIIGAKFIPATEDDIIKNNFKSGVCIIEQPDRTWEDRYYQGVDPIFTASGHSNFGSAIYDALNKEVSAYIDMRSEDYRFCYLQGLLMNLYYSPVKNGVSKGVKQLVEANVGGEYITYIENKGYKSTLIKSYRLPEILQAGGDVYGIRKVPSNTKFIITELEHFLISCLDKNYSDRFWEQLKTYVRKTTTKNLSYEPQNKSHHRDDCLDGHIYAFIGWRCNEKKLPKQLNEVNGVVIGENPSKLRYVLDANYNLSLQRVTTAFSNRQYQAKNNVSTADINQYIASIR